MSRSIKKTVILAAIEAVAQEAETLTAADALLVSNPSFSVEYNNADRNLIRPYMGHGGQLVGTRHASIQFTVELAGSGTKDEPAPWGKLLQACGFAEVIESDYVLYKPVGDNFSTLTIKYAVDGVLHEALGCMGTFSLSLNAEEIPTLEFTFVGIDSSVTATSNPSATYSDWKLPLVATDVNTGQITLGSTLTDDAVAGGTKYCSPGLTLDMANDSQFSTFLGCAHASIADRAPTGNMALEMTSAEEKAAWDDINNNTQTSLSVEHGTQAGGKILIYAPKITRLSPSYQEENGILMLATDFNLEPDAGNDELTIITK